MPGCSSHVAASRERLGDGWLDLYLTAPMWRFFVQPGVLDEQPVGGVLFPSVDRVGRHFPFTVFARLPRRCVGLVVADRCAAWFERVEDLVLAHLEDDSADRRCARRVHRRDCRAARRGHRYSAGEPCRRRAGRSGLDQRGLPAPVARQSCRRDSDGADLAREIDQPRDARRRVLVEQRLGECPALVADHAWPAGAARILRDAFRRAGTNGRGRAARRRPVSCRCRA